MFSGTDGLRKLTVSFPGKEFKDKITQVGWPVRQQVVFCPVWQAVNRSLLLQKLHHGQGIQQAAHAARVRSYSEGNLVCRLVPRCNLGPYL